MKVSRQQEVKYLVFVYLFLAVFAITIWLAIFYVLGLYKILFRF